MKSEKEYCKEKYVEMLLFHQDMENRKLFAQQKIQERSEEIQREIVNKANREIQENQVRQQVKLSLVEQIEKAGMEGKIELVNQLLKQMKELS